jgi:hypothetical protein
LPSPVPPSEPSGPVGEATVDAAVPAPSKLSLSDELKAGHECVPGEEYLVTVRATANEDGSFDISAVDSLEPSAPESPTAEDPEAEKKVLGYDRSKLMSRPKPEAPKLSAKDLEY